MWGLLKINHEIRIPFLNNQCFNGKYPAVFFFPWLIGCILFETSRGQRCLEDKPFVLNHVFFFEGTSYECSGVGLLFERRCFFFVFHFFMFLFQRKKDLEILDPTFTHIKKGQIKRRWFHFRSMVPFLRTEQVPKEGGQFFFRVEFARFDGIKPTKFRLDFRKIQVGEILFALVIVGLHERCIFVKLKILKFPFS